MKENRQLELSRIKRKLDRYFCNCLNCVFIDRGNIVYIVDDKNGNKFEYYHSQTNDVDTMVIIKDIEKQMIKEYYK